VREKWGVLRHLAHPSGRMAPIREGACSPDPTLVQLLLEVYIDCASDAVLNKTLSLPSDRLGGHLFSTLMYPQVIKGKLQNYFCPVNMLPSDTCSSMTSIATISLFLTSTARWTFIQLRWTFHYSSIHSPQLVTSIPVESTAITTGSSLLDVVSERLSFS